jgi:hypothetical protein
MIEIGSSSKGRAKIKKHLSEFGYAFKYFQ